MFPNDITTEGKLVMDYDLGTDELFDMDAIIGDIDVDYDDESLTLPDDELFDE